MKSLSLAVNYNDFIDGREIFPGVGFTYADDRWDLSKWKTRAGKPSSHVLHFDQFVPWLKSSIKKFIAWNWITQALSVSWCQGNLSFLRHLNRYLSTYRPEIKNLSQLDQSVAEGFNIYLNEQADPKRNYQISMGVARFADWLRKGSVNNFV